MEVYTIFSSAFLCNMVCCSRTWVISIFVDRSCCFWKILQGSDFSCFLPVALSRFCVRSFNHRLTVGIEYRRGTWRELCFTGNRVGADLNGFTTVLINYHCRSVCSLSVLCFKCVSWEQGDVQPRISLLHFLSTLEADIGDFYDIV